MANVGTVEGVDIITDMRLDDRLMIGKGKFKMAERYNGQAFLEKAVEAARKIREIYHIFGGYGDTSSPEGGLLGDVYECVADMISSYIAPITGNELNSDELNDITCEIMRMDKEGISDVIKKYCSNDHI